MPKLPTIIFLDENHLSPFLFDLLSKITPRLRQMGYENFYAELSPTLTQEQQINELDLQIDQNYKLTEQVKILENDFYNFLNVSGFTMKDKILKSVEDYFLEKMETSQNEYDFNGYYSFYSIIRINKIFLEKNAINAYKVMNTNFFFEILEKIKSNIVQERDQVIAMKSFLITLNINRINYKGIDDAVRDQVKLPQYKCMNDVIEKNNLFTEISDSTLSSNLDKRNKTMCAAYLQSKQPTFGFAGLAHLKGLQEELCKEPPLELAKPNYIFIYIYSRPSNIIHNDPELELKTIYNSYRNGEIQLPLGVTLINGINKSQDEIIKEVINSIKKQIPSYKSSVISNIADPIYRFFRKTNTNTASKESKTTPSPQFF